MTIQSILFRGGKAILYIVFLTGLIACISYLAQRWGPPGLLFGFVLFPVTLMVTPWLVAFSTGSWWLLCYIYIGGFVGKIMMVYGLPREDD